LLFSSVKNGSISRLLVIVNRVFSRAALTRKQEEEREAGQTEAKGKDEDVGEKVEVKKEKKKGQNKPVSVPADDR